jgi:hypothetical protein
MGSDGGCLEPVTRRDWFHQPPTISKMHHTTRFEARFQTSNDRTEFEEQERVLRDTLSRLNKRLSTLPGDEKFTILASLYQRVSDQVFDTHLSLLTAIFRKKIQVAPTRAMKVAILEEFRVCSEDLATLHSIEL